MVAQPGSACQQDLSLARIAWLPTRAYSFLPWLRGPAVVVPPLTPSTDSRVASHSVVSTMKDPFLSAHLWRQQSELAWFAQTTPFGCPNLPAKQALDWKAAHLTAGHVRGVHMAAVLHHREQLAAAEVDVTATLELALAPRRV